MALWCFFFLGGGGWGPGSVGCGVGLQQGFVCIRRPLIYQIANRTPRVKGNACLHAADTLLKQGCCRQLDTAPCESKPAPRHQLHPHPPLNVISRCSRRCELDLAGRAHSSWHTGCVVHSWRQQ